MQYAFWISHPSPSKIIASKATQEQFIAPVPFPHGSLRGTLVHALFAEWIWRKRWEGSPQNPLWNAEEFPTFESLRAHWTDEELRLMNFAANLTEERHYTKFHYVSTEGFPHERVLLESMAHLVNHGTQHKTEAAAVLTGLGHFPGDMDLIVYLNEAGGSGAGSVRQKE